MSEENAQVTDDGLPSELDTLKARAKQLGVQYHPNIGVDKLRIKVNAKLNPPTKNTVAPVAAIPNKIIMPVVESKAAKLARLRKEASRLIRIRISCMNPNKKEWEGEVFTVSNSAVGTHKKFVPFNNEDGWHVPNIIYKHLLERECQIFQTVKGPRGNKIRKGKLIKEFAIEVLTPLTPVEIQELATQQAMGNNID